MIAELVELTKVCITCKVEKGVDEYGKKKTGKYGVMAECKCCVAEYQKAYREANREAIAEQKKVHYQANKVAIADRQKAYYEVNKEAALEYRKAYYEANRAAELEQAKAYREANKEAVAERERAYKQANKEAVAEYKKAHAKAHRHLYNALNAKRRATKLQATPAWADLEAIKGMYELAAIFNRTGMNLHVDHIVPLQSDLVCGLHCEANLQLLPASDNISKGNRHWPDMPE